MVQLGSTSQGYVDEQILPAIIDDMPNILALSLLLLGLEKGTSMAILGISRHLPMWTDKRQYRL